MIPFYTQEEFDNTKSREKLPLKCKQCGGIFYRRKHVIQEGLKHPKMQPKDFCCNICRAKYANRNNTIGVLCDQCNLFITKKKSDIRKTKHHFCSHSCSAKYHNSRKQTGTRKSKFEAWVEEQLVSLYPNLEFHFNKKDAILSELDIYIPSLKLAFEINGIFHYEPIFGQDKLSRIQNNERRKFAACAERGIGLCIIDTSSLNYFKPAKAQKFLDIITGIIDQTLSLDL